MRKENNEKENSPEKPIVEAEVYKSNKKCDWEKKRKSSKASLGFIVPIKSTTTTEPGKGQRKKI